VRTQQRNRGRKRRVHDAHDSKPSNEEQRAKRVCKLTRHASEALWEQCELSQMCVCLKVSDTKAYVKYCRGRRKTKKEKRNLSLHSRILAREGWLLPVLERTREVKIVVCPITQQRVVVCSCGHYQQHGLKCRHMCAALGGKPEATDAMFCWWLDFDLAFIGEDLPKHVLELIWNAHQLSKMTLGAVMSETQDQLLDSTSELSAEDI
jgi:hypothetical protein